MKVALVLFAILISSPATWSQSMNGTKALKELLGKAIFLDTNLSEPAGQACASCHDPKHGFKGNGDPQVAVVGGAVAGRSGNRNPPSAAYAFASPEPGYRLIDDEQVYVGGQFWDGRAASLADQAKGPFLNPVEMNNPDRASVVRKVCGSNYGLLFKLAYGFRLCSGSSAVPDAYDAIADAIAVFERSSDMNSFSSRYDRYLAGKLALTDKEQAGLQLFEGKAKCAGCHPSGRRSPFTDFTYDNLGIPKNLTHEATKGAPVDHGLGERLGPQENGRFKVSTLRNIAIAPPYGHNGYFQTLKELVHFYNTRDVASEKWPAPEVDENVNRDELGHLGLTAEEEDAIVSFLEALTDQKPFFNPFGE
ncbi:cytochrome-c peroxidase [Paludibaculum fermentans]|uniref:cytochrome-c peroxidase n=1 Tax=Paludibaculum fermentans TaxID=1473598 RepID=UPI003EBDBE9D